MLPISNVSITSAFPDLGDPNPIVSFGTNGHGGSRVVSMPSWDIFDRQTQDYSARANCLSDRSLILKLRTG
jgi:hypothetical protein